MRLSLKGRPVGEGRNGRWKLYDGLPIESVADACVGLPPRLVGVEDVALWSPFVETHYVVLALGIPHLEFICRLDLEMTTVSKDFLRVDSKGFLGRDLLWEYSLPESVCVSGQGSKLVAALSSFAKGHVQKWTREVENG